MKVCNKCGAVFRNDATLTERCPLENCSGIGEIVDIDENLFYAYKLLNSKGYTTHSCCSGHTYDAYMNDDVQTYIAFDKEYHFNKLPKGFRQETDDSESGTCTSIRKDHSYELTNVEIQLELWKTAADVLKWAEGLETNEELPRSLARVVSCCDREFLMNKREFRAGDFVKITKGKYVNTFGVIESYGYDNYYDKHEYKVILMGGLLIDAQEGQLSLVTGLDQYITDMATYTYTDVGIIVRKGDCEKKLTREEWDAKIITTTKSIVGTVTADKILITRVSWHAVASMIMKDGCTGKKIVDTIKTAKPTVDDNNYHRYEGNGILVVVDSGEGCFLRVM